MGIWIHNFTVVRFACKSSKKTNQTNFRSSGFMMTVLVITNSDELDDALSKIYDIYIATVNTSHISS